MLHIFKSIVYYIVHYLDPIRPIIVEHDEDESNTLEPVSYKEMDTHCKDMNVILPIT